MAFDPAIHHRRSIRLKGYDYAQAGAYFVILCTQNRECLFGEIADGVMALNDAGRMTQHWYLELENKYPDIQCDALICMPNHLHFVIVNVGESLGRGERIVGADLRVRPVSGARWIIDEPMADGEPLGRGEHTGSPYVTALFPVHDRLPENRWPMVNRRARADTQVRPYMSALFRVNNGGVNQTTA
ncbi:transposase [Methylobacter luteus]|uniref:transposase n=1 Tax=Methylobacter luteus TaxID=415 RepID=UPI000415C64E|nr:transposase [Methylobacter luteus]